MNDNEFYYTDSRNVMYLSVIIMLLFMSCVGCLLIWHPEKFVSHRLAPVIIREIELMKNKELLNDQQKEEIFIPDEFDDL